MLPCVSHLLQSGENHVNRRFSLRSDVNPSLYLTGHETGIFSVLITSHDEDIAFTRFMEEVAKTDIVELLRQLMVVKRDFTS
jgi:hypothetical protein